ncbi:MAG: hypothetical protein AAGA80_05900 [Cyanobacteria bacterium P01_F01_bin.143]
MTYYLSLILAIGITTLNSPRTSVSLEAKNSQTYNEYQLVAEVPSTNVDDSLNDQPENNLPESPVEPEKKQINKNLFLSAIAVTSIFTIFLLSLLLKKVEVNLEDEVKEEVTEEVKEEELANQATAIWHKENSLDQKENSLDKENILDEEDILDHSDNTILQMPETSQNGSINQNGLISNNHKLPEQEQFQDDTVLVPPNANVAQLDVVRKLILELKLKDSQIRQETILGLAQKGDSRAMIPLVELMVKADSQEKKLIIKAISEITNNTLKTMNQALILSLGDENSQIEPNMIRDLNRVYEVMLQVTEKLSQTVNAPESKVQDTTKWALTQLKKMPPIAELKIKN